LEKFQDNIYFAHVNIYRLRKPEGRRPLGRHRRRWVDNIRMDLQVYGLDRAGPG